MRKRTPLQSSFDKELDRIIARAKKEKRIYITIASGDLYANVFPDYAGGPDQRMVTACDAMWYLTKRHRAIRYRLNHKVFRSSPSKKSSALVIRYYF